MLKAHSRLFLFLGLIAVSGFTGCTKIKVADPTPPAKCTPQELAFIAASKERSKAVFEPALNNYRAAYGLAPINFNTNLEEKRPEGNEGPIGSALERTGVTGSLIFLKAGLKSAAEANPGINCEAVVPHPLDASRKICVLVNMANLIKIKEELLAKSEKQAADKMAAIGGEENLNPPPAETPVEPPVVDEPAPPTVTEGEDTGATPPPTDESLPTESPSHEVQADHEV